MTRVRNLVFLSAMSAAPAAFANYVGVEGGLYKIDYREDLTAPSKSTESGTLKMVGVVASQLDTSIQWIERVSYASATLNYDGAEQITNNPVTSTNPHKFIVAEVTGAFSLGTTFRFYTGLQYRQWNRELGSYEEDYKLFIVPIGLRWMLGGGDSFNIGLDASVRPMVYGWLSVDFRGGYDNMKLPVSMAVGGRIETPMTLKIGADSGLVLAPFYQMIKIGKGSQKSLTVNGAASGMGANEPASTTNEYGARLSFLVGY